MKVSVWIEIQGSVESRELWNLISGYGVNLTEAIVKTWVYGDCSPETAGKVIAACSQFGDLTVSVRRCKDEQKEEESQA